MVVHTCKPDNNLYSWPNINNLTTELVNSSVITISALGPYNWGGPDGDYTTEKPFKGFWPCYYRLIEDEFKKKYNIEFERVWYSSSNSVLNSLKNNIADATEPYMMVGAGFGDISRKTGFSLSCITSATQDKYFTKKYINKDEKKEDNNSYLLAGLICSAIVVLLLGFIFILIMKEKKGEPLFKPLLVTDRQNNNL